MLKTYKNGFIKLINENGLQVDSFKPYEKEVDGNPAFILQFESSPLYFMTRTNSESYEQLDLRYIKFAPSYPKSDYYPPNEWTNIHDVYEFFCSWLNQHVKPYLDEFDVPDLWQQIRTGGLFTHDPLEKNHEEFFSEKEKEQVIVALSKFKEMMQLEFKPTREQQEKIDAKLDYLTESLHRLNKTDWQSIALSTLISISIALSLDTEKGRELFNMFKNAFTTIQYFLSN